ncbi:MAG: homocysteine S-methyltransferase family protein [Trueperaceae bacterium]|nr:MAG: homocysteine S-methyltransferase family protein [Trueperaceae bacterium]
MSWSIGHREDTGGNQAVVNRTRPGEAVYRGQLPQLDGRLFLTDGGIETTLIFKDGLSLPHFAAFDLLRSEEGERALRSYFRTYAAIAARDGVGVVLESATWRASADWGAKLGYSQGALAEANRKAINMLEDIRNEFENGDSEVVISGCIGPRGDGYDPSLRMTVEEAERYHATQVETFAGTAADLVSAITMNYLEEAIGITRAAQKAGMPVVISFTVETDGRLPTGQALGSAIEEVDAATGAGPAYYMVNCAHPTHFETLLDPSEPWVARIRGIRANASTMSHAELDQAEELDDGDPVQLGRQYAELRSRLGTFNVMGGCCGTDHRHIEQISSACSPLF